MVDVNDSMPTYTQGRQFNAGQLSLLSRCMLWAGIGFILIAGIGFGISEFLYRTIDINVLANSINGLWIGSIVLLIAVMIISMIASTKMYRGQASTGLMWSMWILYVIGQGAAFGILALAFQLQFDQAKGILYLLLIFAAGGLAFVISSFVGKKLSAKATYSLGKFIGALCIVFFILMLVFMIASIVCIFTQADGFWSSGLYTLIIGLSLILFLLFLVFDMSRISKMQQFLNVEDKKFESALVMMFGFSLLVDLVGLVWQIAILVLRFSR